jgi:Sulfotransferase domain
MSDSFKIDFVGIGASKSGTTWLGHMLEQHPQLCMSVPKEVHFFNDRLRYRNRIMERNYSKGLSWYKMHFNHCARDKKKGEITPRYCNDPVVPGRIKEHNKDVKIFYCLRSPVDRIASHYNFAKYFVGIEDRSFDQAVREEPEFIDMSLYFWNLSMFLEHFPEEQIFIVWFEDIKDRPEELLKEVYTFLGVDPSFRPARLHEKSNQGRISRYTLLQDYIRKINHRLILLGLSGVVRRLKKAGLGNWIMKFNSKPLQKEKMTPELKAYIIDQVREDVLQLGKWANKDLSHWLQ